MFSRTNEVCVLVACFFLAEGASLVNRATGKCLDIFAPCADGSDTHGCERVPVVDLRKGTNLQLFRCNGEDNQQFELLGSGKLWNSLTSLCLDILAPCKDHLRHPCQRVSVGELQESANVQLWTCQKDASILSNSYGNQEWSLEGAQLKNAKSNMCLSPREDVAATQLGDMDNVQVEPCHQEARQLFDLKDRPAGAQDAKAEFQISDDLAKTGGHGQPSQSRFPLICTGLVALSLVAAILVLWVRRSRKQQSPLE